MGVGDYRDGIYRVNSNHGVMCYKIADLALFADCLSGCALRNTADICYRVLVRIYHILACNKTAQQNP